MSPELALVRVRDFISNECRNKSIRICEAGGGCYSFLPVSSLDILSITTIDIDEIHLGKNRYADFKILGDIQTYTFPADSFDLISCYNVIEHLSSADQAIRQFYHALAPGGILFFGAPDPESLAGLITKYSPHWVHVWFYRVIFRFKNAGQPGHHPFRTVFHPLVAPKRLSEFCTAMGFDVVYFQRYNSTKIAMIMQKNRVIGSILRGVVGFINKVTFGRVDLTRGEYHMVLRKSANVMADQTSSK